MTYASGQLIRKDEYNTFVWGTATGTPSTSVNCLYKLWGTGSGQFGLGQDMSTVTAALDIDPTTTGVQSTASLDPVTGSSTQDITAVQWTGLVSATNRLAYHTLQTNLSIGAGVTVGSRIDVLAGVNSTLSTLAGFMNYPTARKASAAVINTKSISWSVATTATVQTKTIGPYTVQFGSPEYARYFFNAGGGIRVTLSATNNAASIQRSQSMADLINGFGAFTVYGKSFTAPAGSNQSGLATSSGYWNAPTNVPQLAGYSLMSAFNVTDVYSDDYVQIYFWNPADDINGTNGDRGSKLTFQWNLKSGYASTGTNQGVGGIPNYNTDSINLSISATLEWLQPSTTAGGGVLSNTWGPAPGW
jgi:hypothetical protein